MNFNYCPNCGFALTHTALASNPPISVVECGRCGWMMRAGRAPSWNTVSNSTADLRGHGEITCIIDPDCRRHDCLRETCPHKEGKSE